MVIEKVVESLIAKDFKGFSNCFTADAQIDDICLEYVGKPNWCTCGKCAIEMFYHNKFVLGGFSAREGAVVNESKATIITNYRGKDVVAKIRISLNDNGLIDKMIIKPA